MSEGRPVCVVVGAGTKYASNPDFFGDTDGDDLPASVRWGVGGALPIAFARRGYAVAITSRSPGNLAPIAAHINDELDGHCLALACDAADRAAVADTFAEVRRQLGEVDVLCYNAGYAQPALTPDGTSRNPMGGQRVEDLDPDRFDTAHAVHTAGLLFNAQQVLPSMRSRGSGSVLVTGNTMSLRGGPGFGLFAPSKFAQRALTQVMAQEYKPFGVHVAHVIVDGALDAPGMRAMFINNGNQAALDEEHANPGSHLLNPAEVADAFVYLAEQPSSVWTHELTLTPAKVRLGQRL